MRPIEHILVATDLSEASAAATRAAAYLAKVHAARVTLVHVDEDAPWLPPVPLPNAERLAAQAREEKAASLAAALAKIRAIDLGAVAKVETALVRSPSPAQAICEQAKTLGADLIVVGTHGRSGLAHMWIGSVAERIVRHAP